MKGSLRLSAVALAAALLASPLSVAPAAAATPTFADEFAAGPLNTSVWQVKTPWGTQWNNREQMWYDPANFSFANGEMRIKTEKRTVNGYPYASGMITSNTKYSYGYYEMRAKLPKGKGVWPAFWLLADNYQEIDIFELLGDQPNKVYMTYHINHTQPYQATYTGPDFSAGYHTFAVDWQPTYIRWYIDGVKRGEYLGNIPATAQNIIANTAVGDSTSWPGAPDGSTTMPQYFDIQYIRAFRYKPVDPPTPPTGITFTRVAGGDRYATSVAVSQRAFPTGAPAVVVAFGGNYPDALAAAPLARAYGGPVLLTQTTALPSSVLTELRRLAPKQVFVVGSAKSVGPGVASQLAGLPSAPAVSRLEGPDRYGTAAAIADALRAKKGAPGRVVLVNTFPDALSAAPLASAKGWPILLTTRDSLPASTASAVVRSGATSSLVVGSPNVISDAVKALLPSATRVGGKDRYETSAFLADFAKGQGCSYAHVGLATGVNFPDGLVAAPYLAADSGLLLLTGGASLPPSVTSRISANKATVERLDTVGSAASVSDSVLYEAAAALR